jgi:chitodextrinase
MKYILGLIAILILSACGEAPTGKQTVDLGKAPVSNDTVPPVQNLQVLNSSQNAITLRWSDEHNAHGYRIRRNSETVATLSTGLFTFNDTNLEENEEYLYEVVAFDLNGRESVALTIRARTQENNTPVISSQLDQIIVLDSVEIAQVITQIEASDLDDDTLSFSLKYANSLEDVSQLTITESGEVQVSGSLISMSGRVFNILVEVSDGFSISSVGFQLGVIATTANIDNQGLSRNVYNHASLRDDLEVLKALDIFPDSPSFSSIEPSFQSPADIGNNYGQRMLGYLVPPVSGEYQFWIAADDSAELSISDDHLFNNLSIRAKTAGWTSPEQWTKHSEQQSALIELEAGKAYAIQALMVELGGGDHLAVAWQGPGIAQAIIANEYLRLPIDFKAPTAVTELTSLKTAEDAVTLKWHAAQDNVAVDHYEIYNRSELIFTTEALTLELTGLTSATRYDLSVRAVDKAGNYSLNSSVLGIVIDDFVAPTIVTGLNATETGHDFISLSWNVSVDERDKPVLYRIYQQGEFIAQSFDTRLRVASLVSNTEYQFQVEAIDETANSTGLSSILTISTAELLPATPVFAHSRYEFALPVNSPLNQHFGQLAYVINGDYTGSQTVAMSIVAGNQNNYFSLSNSGALTLTNAFLINTNQSYTLTVEISLEGNVTQAEVNIYALTADNFAEKGAFQQVWTGISGSDIASINAQGTVASQRVLSDFKSPTSMGNNYGQKVTAYLSVPEDGLYDFWIASDDASELRISMDLSAEKAELIARVNGFSNEDNWSNGSRVKTQLPLKTGQLYYMEVLHKEGGGGDHMSVAWQGPNLAKGLLSNQYIYPTSSFIPAEIKMETAYQTNFAELGNQIQLELLVNELNAGYPVIIYYGQMDAGQSSTGWQYQMSFDSLTAGQHQILLDNINPGSRYYIRIETQGPLGEGSSSWSDNALVVDTVVIDESKSLGHTLPENIELTVNVNDVDLNLVFEKHSVRSPNFQLLTFDTRRLQQYEAIAPMPEVRTYRGTISNNEFVTVTGVVDSKGTLYISAWGGDSRQWGRNIDINHLINRDALGNTEFETAELKLDYTMPEAVDNQYYLPQPGPEFHNNLSRVAFTFRNSQFMNQAKGNLINAIAQMEGHINELDYVWAQKTGLRWDIGKAVIEANGAIENATQARPGSKDGTTFSMTFQDPRNGGYCWGGGDWLGCVANYTMNWGFTHEVGHNFGLGHGEQTDNNNQIQQPSTHMGNMQARKTTSRLQKGSKFRPAEALINPMLPAAFKDYLTVYQNQSGTVEPLANDFDANGDILSIDSFEATTLAGGTVTGDNGVLTYTPPVGYVGVDQFSYVASDGQFKTTGPVQIQVLANGLTAHWDMDTLNANVVTDLSGQGNDLTSPYLASITAEASLADVQVLGANNQSNQALSIPLMASAVKANDAIGHLLLPHKLDPGHKSFTASMWFKYSAIAGNKLLMGKSSSGPNNMQYGGWEIRSEGNRLEMQVSYRDRLMRNNAAVIEQADALVDGQWHHVAMVIDRENNELRGYLDGTALTTQGTLPLGSGPITAAMNNSGYGGGSPFRVGGHTSVVCVAAAVEGDPQVCTVTDDQAFDTVKLYHRALTEAEILSLFTE